MLVSYGFKCNLPQKPRCGNNADQFATELLPERREQEDAGEQGSETPQQRTDALQAKLDFHACTPPHKPLCGRASLPNARGAGRKSVRPPAGNHPVSHAEKKFPV